MAICFAETDARAMGRDAVGVRGIRLREGDYVVGAGIAAEGAAILSITENGYGKRTDVGEYSVQNRGCLLYTSPSPRDSIGSRMPSSA